MSAGIEAAVIVAMISIPEQYRNVVESAIKCGYCVGYGDGLVQAQHALLNESKPAQVAA